MYEYGLGVLKDLVIVFMWFRIVVDGGSVDVFWRVVELVVNLILEDLL